MPFDELAKEPIPGQPGWYKNGLGQVIADPHKAIREREQTATKGRDEKLAVAGKLIDTVRQNTTDINAIKEKLDKLSTGIDQLVESLANSKKG